MIVGNYELMHNHKEVTIQDLLIVMTTIKKKLNEGSLHIIENWRH